MLTLESLLKKFGMNFLIIQYATDTYIRVVNKLIKKLSTPFNGLEAYFVKLELPATISLETSISFLKYN